MDQIPVNDPIWMQIIPENLLKDNSVSIEKLVEENYDYFANLIGLLFRERL